MAAALTIIVLVVIVPVALLLSLGALAGIMGFLLNNEVDARHEGTELHAAWS